MLDTSKISSAAWVDTILTSTIFDNMGYPPARKFLGAEPLILPRSRAKRIALCIKAGMVNAAASQLDTLVGAGFTPKERSVLLTLMHNYAKASSEECLFQFKTTDRYSDVEEWSVAASAKVNPGTIRSLSGILERVTEEQLDHLIPVSIIASSWRRSTYIMAGPARHLNHDCNANAELICQGREIVVNVLCEIDAGSEITVYYGDHYFGENNRDCLCATCERHERNGWADFNPRRETLKQQRSASKVWFLLGADASEAMHQTCKKYDRVPAAVLDQTAMCSTRSGRKIAAVGRSYDMSWHPLDARLFC